MSIHPKPELTNLINLMGAGDDRALAEALDALYEEMIEVADRVSWSGGRAGQTQTLELVHQGILKVTRREQPWNDRHHFLATFARAIQTARVDGLRSQARRADALSRLQEECEDLIFAEDGPDLELLALDEALGQLEEESPIAAEVVRLRYFAQATHQEVATDLGIPLIRARRLWESALCRLRLLLADEEG